MGNVYRSEPNPTTPLKSMAFYARYEQGQYFCDDAFTDILFALKKWNESDHKTQVMLKHPDM